MLGKPSEQIRTLGAKSPSPAIPAPTTLFQSSAALGIISMAVACFPEAQARVQAQLDRVVGRFRNEHPRIERPTQLKRTTMQSPRSQIVMRSPRSGHLSSSLSADDQ
ncbi:hypothetical protein OBBRIDRAFT_787181 [Obba rivulosa]|uniref:Uncharacterized protein n=1 Tax=Obba rivulosa TaxID=1052685 RepID=A0A8E2DVG3_9APHY|nr:hypothetical protein OBBRIDRAFT_787181 [Obba rivulosa]